MTILVTDQGFAPLPARPAATLDLAPGHDLGNGPGDDLNALAPRLPGLALIRIAFSSAADGRGFSLARRLRDMGYRGALHATGAVIADQYAMARRAGFDAVEIPDEMALRQPEAQWLFRADWRAHDPRQRLRARI